MSLGVNTKIDFSLTFSRLPSTIGSVYGHLDQLLDKMTTGSILPVTIFSPHFLSIISSDTQLVGHRVLSEDCSTRAGYRESVSATHAHANRQYNPESPQVKVCLGDS